jgi:hypothetical protein
MAYFHFATLNRREPSIILAHSSGANSEAGFILMLSSADFGASCFGFALIALLRLCLFLLAPFRFCSPFSPVDSLAAHHRLLC